MSIEYPEENEPTAEAHEGAGHLHVVPEEGESDQSEFDRLLQEHPELASQVEDLKKHFGHLAEAMSDWREVDNLLWGPVSSPYSDQAIINWDAQTIRELDGRVKESQALFEGVNEMIRGIERLHSRFLEIVERLIDRDILTKNRWRPKPIANEAEQIIEEAIKQRALLVNTLQELAQIVPQLGEMVFIVRSYLATPSTIITGWRRGDDRFKAKAQDRLLWLNINWQLPYHMNILVAELPSSQDNRPEAVHRREDYQAWASGKARPLVESSIGGIVNEPSDQVVRINWDVDAKSYQPLSIVELEKLGDSLDGFQAMLDNLTYAQGAWGLFQQQTGQLADLDFPAAYQALTD